MGLCDSYISKDILVNCDSNQSRGLEEDGIIINRKHVDFAKTVFGEKGEKGNIIKTLVLKAGYRGYEVRSAGATPYTGTVTSMVKGTYKNTWNNTLPIVILSNRPEVVEEIIEGLANGTFVVILRNKTKGEGEYQIYGYHQGLMAETIENDKYSEETEGGWLATLQETGSPKAAMFLWNTDGETTGAAYESLKAVV